MHYNIITSISEGFGALLNSALGASAKFASVYPSLLDEGGKPGSVLGTEGKTLLLVPHLCKGEDGYATRSPRSRTSAGESAAGKPFSQTSGLHPYYPMGGEVRLNPACDWLGPKRAGIGSQRGNGALSHQRATRAFRGSR